MRKITSIDSRKNSANEIDSILRDLMNMQGVTAVAIVDKDGLVTHIRRNFDINTDALGVSVQIVFGAASKAANHVNHQSANIVICENAGGYVLLAPITSGFMLSLVTEDDALLGRVRFELKEAIPSLKKLFSNYAT